MSSLETLHRPHHHVAMGPGTMAALTKQPEKAALYLQEGMVQAAWVDLIKVVPAAEFGLWSEVAAITMKPEALRRRCGRQILEFCAANHFAPIGVFPFAMTPALSETLWCYQWNKATADRKYLSKLIGAQSNSLLILLRDMTATRTMPATVRLWGLKGSTVFERRLPHHLRSMISMTNRVLSLVHCPDEPADLVRELGLFFPSATRKAIAAAALEARHGGGDMDAMTARIQSFENTLPYHPVSLEKVLEKLNASPLVEAQSYLVRCLTAGRKLTLKEVREAVDLCGSRLSLDLWDFIVIACELVEHDLPGVEPILDAGAVSQVQMQWNSG